jgi:hypothetical protein
MAQGLRTRERLPEDECNAWHAHWAEVDRLLEQSGKAPGTTPAVSQLDLVATAAQDRPSGSALIPRTPITSRYPGPSGICRLR